VCCQVEVSATS